MLLQGTPHSIARPFRHLNNQVSTRIRDAVVHPDKRIHQQILHRFHLRRYDALIFHFSNFSRKDNQFGNILQELPDNCNTDEGYSFP
jgi:hypothetical protein